VKRSLLVIGIALACGGCAVVHAPTPPLLYGSGEDAAVRFDDLKNAKAKLALQRAATYRADLLDARREAEKVAVAMDLPLIGLAAGAAAGLAFGKPPGQKDLLTGIGIAAGAIAGTRGYLDPAGRASRYHDGAVALGCVLDRGYELALQADMDALDAARMTVNGAVADVAGHAARPPDGGVAGAIYIEMAQLVMDGAIARANAVLLAANDERLAILRTPEAIVGATDRVEEHVFGKTQRAPLSFAALQTTIAGSITAATAGLPPAKAASPARTAATGSRLPFRGRSLTTADIEKFEAARDYYEMALQHTAALDNDIATLRATFRGRPKLLADLLACVVLAN